MEKKRFAKIYTEITTVCNMRCEFCRGTARAPQFIDRGVFARRAAALAPYTNHLYLHVMGEPLLHPELGEIIDAVSEAGLRASITTNGTLLEKRLPLLLGRARALYKVSISLHSFEANGGGDMEGYLSGCFEAARALGSAGVIAVLRLWNLEGLSGTAPKNSENERILGKLREYFFGEWVENRSGMKIGDGVYLEWGERFDWPDMTAPDGGEHGFCYAMKDHVAVLCDGSVVPCCLDGDGQMVLGSIDSDSLCNILNTPEALAISQGFASHRLTHPLCRRCGFAKRW